MKANTYQDLANITAIYYSIMYPFGSLAEEAGEVMGKLNKYTRKRECTYEAAIVSARLAEETKDSDSLALRADLIKELGDLQWQIAMAAKEIGVTLEDIMVVNLEKLQGRVVRGTVEGSGDER